MSDQKFKKGIEDFKKIGLTGSEKFQVKSNLDFYIETTTPAIPVKSTWFSTYHFAFTKLYSASFVVVLMLGVGTGMYYKAEDSLPGDALYSLKVSVIEPIRYTTAVGELAKANLEVANLDTRLKEAETLEIRGKLTEAISNDLQNRIYTHTEAFNKIVGDLSNQNKLDEDSDLQIDFDAKINAHNRVIDIIKSSDSGNLDKIKVAIGRGPEGGETVMLKVASAPKIAMFSVVEDTQVATTTASTTVDKLFSQRKKDTEEIIKSARKNIEKSKKNLKTNVKILDEAEGLINEAQKSLDDAERQSRSGDKGSAREFLNNSRMRAKEANNSVELSQDLSREED